jgi:hypothetical protein
MRSRAVLVATVLVLGGALPAAAQSVPGSGGWAPGPDAAGDNTYAGVVDQPANGSGIAAGSAFHVSGWAVDTTAEGWAGFDGLNVYVGGQASGTPVARGTVGEARPDVAAATGNGFWAASGFDALVPAGAVPSGQQTLTIAAHTPGKGTWVRQVSVNVGGGGGGGGAAGSGSPVQSVTGGPVSPALTLTILSPNNNEQIPGGTAEALVRGVTGDTRTTAALGVGVDRVQVFLDAPRGQAGSQKVGDATINQDGSWQLLWLPTRFNTVSHHVMYIYARSAVTGEEILKTVELNISS